MRGLAGRCARRKGLVERSESQPGSTRGSPAEGDVGSRLAPILERAAAGDEHAWQELLRLYSRRVFAMARSRLGNSDVAEEITQSVFATIATKMVSRDGEVTGYVEQGRFEAWLFRVTMNRVRDEVRRSRRRAVATEPETLDTARTAPESSPQGAPADALSALREAMATLSESDREVIELRHHAGLSFKQIAELVNEPLGTLLARHHRALRKLKSAMGQDPLADDASPASATEVLES